MATYSQAHQKCPNCSNRSIVRVEKAFDNPGFTATGNHARCEGCLDEWDEIIDVTFWKHKKGSNPYNPNTGY